MDARKLMSLVVYYVCRHAFRLSWKQHDTSHKAANGPLQGL